MQQLKANVILIGASGVGKTNLIFRQTRDVFYETSHPTITSDFLIYKTIIHNQEIAFNIWDTAGQERFNAITENFLRKADMVGIVFDCTNEDSFDKAIDWYGKITAIKTENIPKILIGNKKDSNCDTFDHKQVTEFAKDKNMKFIQTSAKTGENVNEAFTYLFTEWLQSHKPQKKMVPSM